MIQVGADITKSLDASKPPNLTLCDLTPDYSYAALNYCVDYYRQIHSQMSKQFFWAGKTSLMLLSINVLFFSWRFYDEIVEIYEEQYYSLEGLSFLFGDLNRCLQIVLVLMSSLAFVLIYVKLRTYSVREESDAILANGGESVFGVNLKLVATKKDKSAKVDGAQVAVYREVPIAVIAVDKNGKIRCLSVRQVYKKIGLQNELLDWAIKRAPGSEMSIDVFSVDKQLIDIVEAKGFKKSSVSKLSCGFEKYTYVLSPTKRG